MNDVPKSIHIDKDVRQTQKLLRKKIKRVMVFGVPASGKSTFSMRISELLNLPLYHIDRYFFVENWRLRDAKEFLDIQEKLVEQEKWVIDGNAITSLEVRYAKADLVVYFHFSHWVCLWRAVKRVFHRDPRIDDRPAGCPNTLSWRFLYVLWVFDRLVKDKIILLRHKYSGVNFYEFRNDEDVRKFLEKSIE